MIHVSAWEARATAGRGGTPQLQALRMARGRIEACTAAVERDLQDESGVWRDETWETAVVEARCCQ